MSNLASLPPPDRRSPAFSRYIVRPLGDGAPLDPAETQMTREWYGRAGVLRHMTPAQIAALDAELSAYAEIKTLEASGLTVHPSSLQRANAAHKAALERALQMEPELSTMERLAVTSIREAIQDEQETKR